MPLPLALLAMAGLSCRYSGSPVGDIVGDAKAPPPDISHEWAKVLSSFPQSYSLSVPSAPSTAAPRRSAPRICAIAPHPLQPTASPFAAP